MKKPKSKLLPDSLPQLSAAWSVSERTAKRMLAKGAPLRDEAAMIAWAKDQPDLPEAIQSRIEAITCNPATRDTDWAEFVKQQSANTDPKEAMAKITEARDFAAFKFKKAALSGRKVEQKFYSDLLAKFESTLHDAQLRARKLGMDEGELMPWAEVERIIFSIGYWLMRSTDQHLDAISSKLAALSPGFSLVAVRSVLDQELLSDRFLVPFTRAASIQSGVTVPPRVVAKLRQTCGDFLSHGEASFDREKNKT